ncbi:unnamed protein product [Sphagnum jensenii]|uniref:Uncharacterized protein n=1 Tax=Sphagnum jensenii TaxID=128206 RepID=A0ABP1BYH8_9BRYO
MSQAYISGTIHRNIVFVDDLSLGVQCVLGIVVIQEWWGVNFEIKKHAIDITSKGLSCPGSSFVSTECWTRRHPCFASTPTWMAHTPQTPTSKLDPITPLEGPLLTLVQRRLLTSSPVTSGMDFINLNRMVQLNPQQVSSRVFSGTIVKPNVAAALKQSLVTASSMQWVSDIEVGDYESSDGIVGTGFWMAPEVEYSAGVDVYLYAFNFGNMHAHQRALLCPMIVSTPTHDLKKN